MTDITSTPSPRDIVLGRAGTPAPGVGAAVGAPMNRIDGRLKVTGGARYSAEMPVTGVHHAVIVQSTVANGRIRSLDTAQAERMMGVVKVFTHRNTPTLAPQVGRPPASRVLTLLQDDVAP